MSNARPDTMSHPPHSRPHSQSSNTTSNPSPTEFQQQQQQQQQQALAATDTTDDNNNNHHNNNNKSAMDVQYGMAGMPSSIPSVNRCVPIQVMYPHISLKKIKPTKFEGYVLLFLFLPFLLLEICKVNRKDGLDVLMFMATKEWVGRAVVFTPFLCLLMMMMMMMLFVVSLD
jgi:hypothetical protein